MEMFALSGIAKFEERVDVSDFKQMRQGTNVQLPCVREAMFKFDEVIYIDFPDKNVTCQGIIDVTYNIDDFDMPDDVDIIEEGDTFMEGGKSPIDVQISNALSEQKTQVEAPKKKKKKNKKRRKNSGGSQNQQKQPIVQQKESEKSEQNRVSHQENTNAQNFKTLDETDDNLPYDQFKDKKSTYSFDKYTTKIDKSKLSKGLHRKAEQVERELKQKNRDNLDNIEDAHVTRDGTQPGVELKQNIFDALGAQGGDGENRSRTGSMIGIDTGKLSQKHNLFSPEIPYDDYEKMQKLKQEELRKHNPYVRDRVSSTEQFKKDQVILTKKMSSKNNDDPFIFNRVTKPLPNFIGHNPIDPKSNFKSWVDSSKANQLLSSELSKATF